MGKRRRVEEGEVKDEDDAGETTMAKKAFPSHIKNKLIRSLQYSKVRVEKKKLKKSRRQARDVAEEQALELGEAVDSAEFLPELSACLVTMSTSKDRDIYDIKKFDGTNFQLRKNQMQDVLVQKKQKLPIIYATRIEEMNMTQFQWEELDELCRSTIRLHLAGSVYFSVLECESAYALWQKLCNTYEKGTVSNNVFMMRKLFNLCMKESASVASHINDFDSLFVQIRTQRINIDDEMKAIFLLCSLPPSWDIFCTADSTSAFNGTLVYIDVASSLLSEEMRRRAMGSSHHGEAHYVQKDRKQRKDRSWNRKSKKEDNRDASKGRSKFLNHRNVQCHYCDKLN
ncbi:hypothetical protein L7F22_004091 [Adiantum nelumboides]|nr:hypothetical protein [Adiantum nelumboides]